MNSTANRWKRAWVLLAAFLLVFPFLMLALTEILPGTGLVWWALGQLYYVPVSWIAPPLFPRAAEVFFVVTPAGRVLALCIYGAILSAAHFAIFRRREA